MSPKGAAPARVASEAAPTGEQVEPGADVRPFAAEAAPTREREWREWSRSEPYGIPQGIVAKVADEARAQRSGDEVTGDGGEVLVAAGGFTAIPQIGSRITPHGPIPDASRPRPAHRGWPKSRG